MKDSVKAVIAVALLILAGVVTAVVLRSRNMGDVAYYYDESDRKLFVATAGQIPPIEGDGVLAVVYVCGDRKASKADRKIAYLMTYSPELAECMRQAAAASRGEGAYPEKLGDRIWVNTNTLVRLPDAPDWHPLNSSAGQAAMAVLTTKCEDGSFPTVCSPTD